jgi:hypothetical protein
MLDEFVPLFEAAVIEQQRQALSSGELAFSVLLLNSVFAAAKVRGGPLCLQFLNNVLHVFSFEI